MEKVKLVYIGVMSGVQFDKPLPITMIKNEPCDVPKSLADELLKRRAKEFEVAGKAKTSTAKKVT